jgi:hypothetical protein
MNQVTQKGIAYINQKYQSVEGVIKGYPPIIDTQGYWPNEPDYVRIGTVELTITLDTADEITVAQIEALKKQLEDQRAAAHLAERAILDRISKLQALTNEVTL